MTSRVELVQEPYGSDLFVANCARVSFAKWNQAFTGKDARLIAYLARENHFAPFCHPHLSFRITAAMPIARQLFKHVVGLIASEESRRYVDGPVTFHQHDAIRSRPDGSIKQGSGGEHPQSAFWKLQIEQVRQLADSVYRHMIEDGVCPEQARFELPQSAQTTWIWTGSLYAFARVCRLRLDPHAQHETREVARQISRLIVPYFPVSWGELMADAHLDAEERAAAGIVQLDFSNIENA